VIWEILTIIGSIAIKYKGISMKRKDKLITDKYPTVRNNAIRTLNQSGEKK